MSAPLSKAEAAEMLASAQDPDRWLRDAIGRRIETLASNATASVELRAIAELVALHAAWAARPVPSLSDAPVGTVVRIPAGRYEINGGFTFTVDPGTEAVKASTDPDPEQQLWQVVDGGEDDVWTSTQLAETGAVITCLPRAVDR